MSGAALMFVALVADAAMGWPAWLFARIGHPVTWLGALISTADDRLNRAQDPLATRRVLGLVTAVAVIAVAVMTGLAVSRLLPGGWAGLILGGLFAYPLVAFRSLDEHVAAVAAPMAANDIAGARAAVARIVGRDPALLDGAGIARAAIESLAENTSDGVIAPLFWGVIFGLPGIAAYKAINTLDSMIGHRTPRHEAFGWAAARIDDVVNFLPARLTGLLFAIASGAPGTAIGVMLRDARAHRSPNAGWPEAAMAGALGIRLSGPRQYTGRVANEPWLNAAARDPDASDLRRALQLYHRSMLLISVLLGLLALGVFF